MFELHLSIVIMLSSYSIKRIGSESVPPSDRKSQTFYCPSNTFQLYEKMRSVSSSDLLQKFQRDINRMSDSDRNTRKRGLQKLLEELPWNSNKQKKALESLLSTHILVPLIAGVSG
jgi:hypothetical protein